MIKRPKNLIDPAVEYLEVVRNIEELQDMANYEREQLKAFFATISNKALFSYDASTDPLFFDRSWALLPFLKNDGQRFQLLVPDVAEVGAIIESYIKDSKVLYPSLENYLLRLSRRKSQLSKILNLK